LASVFLVRRMPGRDELVVDIARPAVAVEPQFAEVAAVLLALVAGGDQQDVLALD